MSVLIFPKLNFNNIFFLFFLISFFAKLYINKLSNKEENKEKGEKPEYNCRLLFNIYIYTISDLFSIFLFIIVKIKSRTHTNKQNNYNKTLNINSDEDSNSSKKIVYKGHLPINEHKLFLNIFLVAITDLLAAYVKLIFFLVNKNYERPYIKYLLIFNIFFKYLFSKIFLKNKFYRHHYLSFVINIIGLVLLEISQITGNKNVKRNLKYFSFVL